MTRNEIKKYIKEKYGIDSVSLWEKFPNYLVFRNVKKKWFAIIMDVPYDKLYRDSDNKNKIDILNVKLEPEFIFSINDTKGFLSAYHMDKTHWVSVDINKLSKKKIKSLIDISFDLLR